MSHPDSRPELEAIQELTKLRPIARRRTNKIRLRLNFEGGLEEALENAYLVGVYDATSVSGEIQ